MVHNLEQMCAINGSIYLGRIARRPCHQYPQTFKTLSHAAGKAAQRSGDSEGDAGGPPADGGRCGPGTSQQGSPPEGARQEAVVAGRGPHEGRQGEFPSNS